MADLKSLALILCAMVIPHWSLAAAADDEIAWPNVVSKISTDPVVEKRVDEILGNLSLEQKVGQMVQAEIRHVTPADVRTHHLGSVLNGGGSFPGNDK
ncbi:MAG: glycoside hydrolase family 3 protein, partial [Gammaproteobacteria bacterium]